MSKIEADGLGVCFFGLYPQLCVLRCNVTSDGLNNKGPKEPKRRVEKSSKAEREVVFAILKDAAVFTEKGRMSFSGLWESAKKFVQLPRRGEASSSNDYGLGRAIEKLFGRPEAAQVDAEEDDEEEDEEGGVAVVVAAGVRARVKARKPRARGNSRGCGKRKRVQN